MSQVRELDANETRRAAAALLELRPHVGTAETMTARVDAQRAEGYRVAAAFDPDGFYFRHRLRITSYHFARGLA